MPIKIMHVVQSPGGVERYIQMLIKYMDKDRFRNVIVCSYDYKEENYRGLVDSFENIEMDREINLLKDLRAIIEIRKKIKKYSPDIVYFHSSKAGAVGRLANLGINNRALYNPHGWSFNMDCSKNKKRVYKFIEKILAHLTDYIVAISECEKTRAINNRICEIDKIGVILNGIDIEEYDNKKKYTEKDTRIPEGAYVIGTVGRLSFNKAQDTFIKAASMIKEIIPNAFFILVGDGPDRKKIEDLIKDYSLEDCTMITGWIEDPYQYIDCFNQGMLLTRWEGFGLVLAEYMLANVPIIATNIDSIPELIAHRENGMLVRVDDVEGIVQASVEYFNNLELTANNVSMGNKIVREKFDVKRVVEEHEKLFEKIK